MGKYDAFFKTDVIVKRFGKIFQKPSVLRLVNGTDQFSEFCMFLLHLKLKTGVFGFGQNDVLYFKMGGEAVVP
ncbi:hypothetical protein D3C78_1897190 [compost metagenome]